MTQRDLESRRGQKYKHFFCFFFNIFFSILVSSIAVRAENQDPRRDFSLKPVWQAPLAPQYGKELGQTFTQPRPSLNVANTRSESVKNHQLNYQIAEDVFLPSWENKTSFQTDDASSGYQEVYLAELSLSTELVAPQPTEARQAPKNKQVLPVSGNPAASEMMVGTGDLGRWLGLEEHSPLRLGGLFIGNVSQQLSGGTQPGATSFNGSLILGLGVDLEKAFAWDGAFFEVEMLQFNGQPVNERAGTAQGYNSLEATAPLNRTELYQIWLNQTFDQDRLSFRIGKLIPSMNFGSVGRPLITQSNPQFFASTTALNYTPVFVAPSLLGFIPGYYNSAYGIYGSWKSWGDRVTQPSEAEGWYVQAGLYDGRGAQGIQTGLTGPNFAGALFNVVEVGGAWTQFPGLTENSGGSFAVGGWHQSGPLSAPGGATEVATGGFYTYLVQKLVTFRESDYPNGIISFLQGGWNNSRTAIMNASFGFGLTFLGPFSERPLDSYGLGFSWAKLNDSPDAGYGFNGYETMLQAYAQYHLFSNYFLQPIITVLPTPGIKGAGSPAWATTLQIIVPF